MADYQLTATDAIVIRITDQAWIPNDPANRDWVEYQNWLALGNVPDPYKPPPPPPPDAVAIVDQSYRAGLVRQADKLQANGKNYDAIKLLLKATS
jgi:hypothetical protein